MSETYSPEPKSTEDYIPPCESDNFDECSRSESPEEQLQEQYEQTIGATKQKLEELKIECPNPLNPNIDMCDENGVLVSDDDGESAGLPENN